LNIELILTPPEIEPEVLTNKNTVSIDVLRASTTITTALQNQCRQIIPVAEVETAKKLASFQSRETTLLCGERNGKRIEGFHLGNSPSEYSVEIVKNKTLIFTTTNGSRLLTQTQNCKNSFVASFVNISQVTDFLLHDNSDVVILCAGRVNRFSLEDTVCGGMIVNRLYRTLEKGVQLTDTALAAMVLYQKFQNNILNMLRLTVHGRYLIEIGMQNDLITCSNIDSVPVIPVFKKGVITQLKEQLAVS
jgi:2-phosphosulfolactate phosphatase